MNDNYSETWREIREGLGLFFKVFAYSILALGIIAMIAYAWLKVM